MGPLVAFWASGHCGHERRCPVEPPTGAKRVLSSDGQETGRGACDRLTAGGFELNGRLCFASKKRPAGMGIFAPMILDFGRCAQACRSPLLKSCNSLGYSLLPINS